MNYSNSSRIDLCSPQLLNEANIVFELDLFIKQSSFFRVRVRRIQTCLQIAWFVKNSTWNIGISMPRFM